MPQASRTRSTSGAHSAVKTAEQASPDADLVASCVHFHALHAEVIQAADLLTASSKADEPARQAALDAAMDQRWKISYGIEAVPARTLDGVRAKAGMALALMDENGGTDADWRIAYGTLRDLVGASS